MDLGGWLRSLGLAQYEAAFRENAINEAILPKLTAEDLKDIGVTAVGHRRVLLDAIAALRGETRLIGHAQPGDVRMHYEVHDSSGTPLLLLLPSRSAPDDWKACSLGFAFESSITSAKVLCFEPKEDLGSLAQR